MSLVALVPGVVPQGGSQGNPSGNNVNGWGNFQFGGGIANQGAEYFDGVLLNTSYTNQPALIPSQDFVKEFIVSSNNTTAEYGNTSGGVVNMASKSGTNELHFSAYEFVRNKLLNANLFFSKRNNIARAAFTQNQYGATIGGPILKQKAFVFGSWEGFALRQGNTLLTSVPTVAEKGGDFSAANFGTIYDPCGAAGTTNGGVGYGLCAGTPAAGPTPFPGNKIPAGRLDPVVQHLLAQEPNPNINTATPVNNFVRSYPTGTNYNQYNVRGDYTLTQSQNLFVRYAQWDIIGVPNDTLGTKVGRQGKDYSKQAVIGDTWTISPTMILDSRIAFTRFQINAVPMVAGLDQTTLGLPGSYNSEMNRGWPTPCIAGEFTNFCSNNLNLYQIGAANNYEIVSGLTKILGRHTMKAGLALRTQQFNYAQTQFSSGFYAFDGTFTNSLAKSGGTGGDAFASYILGYPNNTTSSTSSQPSGIQEGIKTAGAQRYQGYYFTDTWQVGSRLTATLGVRWEIPTFWRERHNSMDVFMPTTASPLGSFKDPTTLATISLQGLPAIPGTAAYSSPYGMVTKLNMFAPRIGLAYRASNSLVIRSGYGLFYIPTASSFWSGPVNLSVNAAVTPIPIINGTIPTASMSNPFPNGFLFAPGPDASKLPNFYGSVYNTLVPNQKRSYNQQWNLAIQKQLNNNSSL